MNRAGIDKLVSAQHQLQAQIDQSSADFNELQSGSFGSLQSTSADWSAKLDSYMTDSQSIMHATYTCEKCELKTCHQWP